MKLAASCGICLVSDRNEFTAVMRDEDRFSFLHKGNWKWRFEKLETVYVFNNAIVERPIAVDYSEEI